MPAEEPEPRPSSTVVLVRRAANAPEVFMVKRHKKSAFGSRYAFPGGVLEASDARVHAMSTGRSAEQANRLLGVDSGGLDYYSAAIRELFEESGVLLAERALPADVLQTARAALNVGELDWYEFVAEQRLVLLYDRLHYFSYWITPVGLPKRFATRFFLAQVGSTQVATHCGGELTESCWLPAAEVLRARKEKTMKVPYPTRKTLKRVAQFDSITELLQWAEACGEKGVVCDQPAFPPEAVL